MEHQARDSAPYAMTFMIESEWNELERFNVITDEIQRLAQMCVENNSIPQELYAKYEVKRGLRNRDGQGVLTGLTEISMINAFRIEDLDRIPIEGKLYYHGIDIEERWLCQTH